MGSRKEEERNEKIIRGLMKLPPNRRCINCNSLAPQYVCTNFWTFVCMTCSGIHREFTHRVKSVSMAKFSSQEVEALQNGGNQRAREIYLRNWDFQRQRLPDNSNANKVRDFIKNVYVDRRYAGGQTFEKPPNDTQGLGSHDDETRRASSYHSYSQSPPYDYQYEERRYGKHDSVLTRKPGSDRGHYVRKISSLVYSPGCTSEQIFEHRFANEGSGSRISDYSMSSGGDPFRSGTQSTSFKQDVGFNSPPIQPSRDIVSSVANFKRDADGIQHPQRASSLGSMGSFDSDFVSLKSYNSGGLADVSEPEQAAGAHQDKTPTFLQSLSPVNYGGLDLFQAPVVPDPVSSTTLPIDLFQLPAMSSAPVNVVQTSQASSAPSINSYQRAQTSSPSSFNFFEIPEQPSTANLDRNRQELYTNKSQGWATFDSPFPATPISATESLSPATVPGNVDSSVKFDPFPSSITSMDWPAFQNSGAHGPALSSGPWFDNLLNVQAPAIATSTQDSNNDGNLTAASHHEPPGTGLNVQSHVDMGPSYNPLVVPLLGEVQAPVTENKSTNPFDFPGDFDLEQSNMFLDMSSLQAALPNGELSSTFLGGATQSWFPQNTVPPFIPEAALGGLAYMSGQSPTAQLPNVPTQEPVAPVGGNPFA